MADSTPPLMTEEQFNASVRKWAIPIRNKMVMNAQNKTKGKGKGTSYSNIKTQTLEVPLSGSIRSSVLKKYGTASRVRFSFARQGVYIHYGVGRGYIRSGNGVTRGSKNDKSVKTSGPINRKPVDWFDVEIKNGINALADIVQEYYGDDTMREILEQYDKALIEKKIKK
ncbi:hypothetical protein M2132_001829 [Dysgonomonas sp. PH5-45]|uniref:hypothetical protein n=1 Tax=unclassified Dysgonomonas TaxID=2630389 RepID=UPI0024757EC1|nr:MULTISPECIES: hypothetical protein [unclassified Dysgonomonas]MDH6355486.1 hypothetical protein [Dysgonomonas sp. PH5-45]MDH6388382.1 hypothetical protein [Dysgonomonas sp. PH5-37]